MTTEIAMYQDSLSLLQAHDVYKSELLSIGMCENNKKRNFDSVTVYILRDGKPHQAVKFSSLLLKDKNTLVVRYTEIGCNACSDLTFKTMERSQELRNKYNIIVLVDFSNYDAYLKWKKISEITYPIFWIQKGKLPFETEHQDYSYLFTINKASYTNDFFKPHSIFTEYVENYINHLLFITN